MIGHSKDQRLFVIELTLVMLLIVGPAIWIAVALDARWGSIADWVAALATVAAVAVAIYAGNWAKRAFELEAKRERAAAEKSERAQAERIAAWLVGVPPEVHEDRPFSTFSSADALAAVRGLRQGKTPSPPPPSSKAKVALRNSSELPVTSVCLLVSGGEAGLPSGRSRELQVHLAVLPPSDAPMPIDVEVDALRATTFIDLGFGCSAKYSFPARPLRIEVAINFTDAAGQRWHRGRDGILTRL